MADQTGCQRAQIFPCCFANSCTVYKNSMCVQESCNLTHPLIFQLIIFSCPGNPVQSPQHAIVCSVSAVFDPHIVYQAITMGCCIPKFFDHSEQIVLSSNFFIQEVTAGKPVEVNEGSKGNDLQEGPDWKTSIILFMIPPQ